MNKQIQRDLSLIGDLVRVSGSAHLPDVQGAWLRITQALSDDDGAYSEQGRDDREDDGVTVSPPESACEVNIPRGWYLFADAFPEPGDVVDVRVAEEGEIIQVIWPAPNDKPVICTSSPSAWAFADDPGGWPAKFEDKATEVGNEAGQRYLVAPRALSSAERNELREWWEKRRDVPPWWRRPIAAYDEAAASWLNKAAGWVRSRLGVGGSNREVD